MLSVKKELPIYPIGSIFAWAKDIKPDVLFLSEDFVECNGQVLDMPDSILHGQTIPNLNGDNRYLRGAIDSNNEGGTKEHRHTVVFESSVATESGGGTSSEPGRPTTGTEYHSDYENHEPPYYTVTWIMRVK